MKFVYKADVDAGLIIQTINIFFIINMVFEFNNMNYDAVAEWLRRWTANPLCSARVGSNPIHVEILFYHYFIQTIPLQYVFYIYCEIHQAMIL